MLWCSVVLALALTQYSQATCLEECVRPRSLYEDIKCKPIFDKPGDCCPIKYDCSHIAKRPNGKCLLQDKIYNVDEKVPDDLTYGTCQVGCRCSENGKFTCAVLDCPEYLGVRPPSNCWPKYELDKCCSVGHLCPPLDHIAKCVVDGKTYYEGQRFSPSSDECLKCVCQKGFKGEFVEPFCRKRQCFTELHHSPDIVKNCAAVYDENNKCCPNTFICPDESSPPVILTRLASSAGPTCVYGRNDLLLGEKFQNVNVVSDWENITTTCECTVPPLATCVRNRVFDMAKASLDVQDIFG